jgi:hypothetical protein
MYGLIASRLSSIIETSSKVNGAPESPSIQHAPLHALRSQTNFFSNKSKETILSWISRSIMEIDLGVKIVNHFIE